MKKLLLIIFTISIGYTSNLSNISTQRLAGQMIMVGFNGKNIKEHTIRKLGEEASLGKIGGVVFRANNFTDVEQAKKLVSRFKNIAIVNPLFLGFDYLGMNNPNFDIISPNFKELNKNLNESRIDYFKTASIISDLGINLNLSLNLNTNFNELNKMSIYAREYADMFKNNKLLISIKNFPGDMNNKEKKIENYKLNYLRPFYDFIQTEYADMIMVSNKTYPILDNKPANMSEKIINILRNDLGYHGVIISDDILGGDLDEYTFDERVINSINAGVDILYFGLSKIKYGDTASYVVDIITKAVNDGKIARKRLEESYLKITSLKEKL